MKNQPPESELQFDIGATEDSLERMTALAAELGDIYRVYAPGRKSWTYVINHPDDVKRVLVSQHRNYTKGLGLDRVKILLGLGLMTSEGGFWKRQRYMMQPMFHRRMVTEFGRIIDAANERFIAQWEAQAALGELVNVTDDMSELTLDIVLRSIFGKDMDRLTHQPGGNPFDVVTKNQERNLKFAYEFRSLGKLIAQLMQRRRRTAEEHFDLLAMLMNARDRDTDAAMSEKELVDEVMTLVVAGHETTASALNWIWYLLSQHPEVEARLHAEIDAAFENAPSLPSPVERGRAGRGASSLAQMEALSYTSNVIDEALRLYPPGWLLSRRTIAPDVLGGYDIPAGTDILLSPYLLHRHPKFWQEPDSFRPERFSEEHDSDLPRFAYVPFAGGPRHCIGETFAIYEMLMHLYKVARRYRLVYAPDKPVELEALINLRPKNPLYMRLERR